MRSTGRSRAGPPAQSGALRNWTRAGLVPEVDLIAPDKLSFPLSLICLVSPFSNAMAHRPRHSEPFPFCLLSPVSANSIPYRVHCTHPARGPARPVRYDRQTLSLHQDLSHF